MELDDSWAVYKTSDIADVAAGEASEPLHSELLAIVQTEYLADLLIAAIEVGQSIQPNVVTTNTTMPEPQPADTHRVWIVHHTDLIREGDDYPIVEEFAFATIDELNAFLQGASASEDWMDGWEQCDTEDEANAKRQELRKKYGQEEN